jgi:hypothetical protein
MIFNGRKQLCEKYVPVLLFHHKSDVEWARREPGPPRWDSGDQPPESRHGLQIPLLCVQWNSRTEMKIQLKAELVL